MKREPVRLLSQAMFKNILPAIPVFAFTIGCLLFVASFFPFFIHINQETAVVISMFGWLSLYTGIAVSQLGVVFIWPRLVWGKGRSVSLAVKIMYGFALVGVIVMTGAWLTPILLPGTNSAQINLMLVVIKSFGALFFIGGIYGFLTTYYIGTGELDIGEGPIVRIIKERQALERK